MQALEAHLGATLGSLRIRKGVVPIQLEGSEHVLDCPPAQRHGLGCLSSRRWTPRGRLRVPSARCACSARRALRLDGALRAGAAPIAAQLQAVLFTREAVDGTLARRALILIVLGDVDEVALSKRPSALAFEVMGLGRIAAIPASSHALICGPL
jgi:hypothetical protein